MSNATKMNQKEQKESTKESGLSSTIMDQSQSTTQHINPIGRTMKRKGLIMVIINIECAIKQEFLDSWNHVFWEFPWSRL